MEFRALERQSQTLAGDWQALRGIGFGIYPGGGRSPMVCTGATGTGADNDPLWVAAPHHWANA